jgi:hypothetical protein
VTASVETFLTDLHGRGVTLWVEGDKLKLRAAEGVLSPEMTDAVRGRKAEILAFLRPEPVYSIPPLAPLDHYELSAAQRRRGCRPSCRTHRPPTTSRCISLSSPLCRAALNGVCPLVQRHESLRTTFVSADGEPRQVVHAELTVPIMFHDLARRDDAEDVARTLGREEAGKPFDLAAGPLLRVGLLRLDAERHVLLFTIHHIIADGVSLSVLARDLSRLYESARTGSPDGLPALSIGYPAYAAWQNRVLSGALVAPHRAYWHAALSGDLPVLNLPTDITATCSEFPRRRAVSMTPCTPTGAGGFCRQHNATLSWACRRSSTCCCPPIPGRMTS